MFSFHGIAFLVHHFHGKRAVVVGTSGSGYGNFELLVALLYGIVVKRIGEHQVVASAVQHLVLVASGKSCQGCQDGKGYHTSG